MKILVIEDDPRISGVIKRTLAESGFAVDQAFNTDDGLESFVLNAPDLVILDLMLPGSAGGGMGVCRQMRTSNTDTPILMLTALDSMGSRVAGLDTGADDYLVKPFHLAELLARVRALLRRAPTGRPPILRAGGIVLDPATQVVTRGERQIPLTPKEFAVLEYLMLRAGIIVSSSELIDHAWDSNYDGFSNVVQTYIRYLRQKLHAPGESEVIRTFRGAGYLIEPD